MAKLFGVRVLAFAIGFGPKVLRFRGPETEYSIGLFPLGGYVKMLERTDASTPRDAHRVFDAQPLWKRIAIVLAGPAMNIMFPVVLYTSVFLEDRAFLPAQVGAVLPGKPADGKLAVGDRILAVDGIRMGSFPDVQQAVAPNAGRPLGFRVERDGREVEVTITPVEELEPRELDVVDRIGRIGIAPNFPAPVIGVPHRDSPAFLAGLRTFDRVVSVNGKPLATLDDLFRLLSANHGDSVVLNVRRPIVAPAGENDLAEIALYESRIFQLMPVRRDSEAADVNDANERARDVLVRTGIEGSEMMAAIVPENSTEWRAGLRSGDRIVALDGQPQGMWQLLEAALMSDPQREHRLEWTRLGEPMSGALQLQEERLSDDFGQTVARYAFRTIHWAPEAQSQLVPNPSPVTYAIRHGFAEAGRVMQFIGIGLARLVEGRVSLSSVSGPITIYDIAGRAGAKGRTYFIWAMAMISMNLGLINLLPIPVLDGGQLAFLVIEAVSKRPISRRSREVANWIGMTLLALLMIVAFKNDIERHWELIRAAVREIFYRT